jgi:GDP-L-fucose synthase
MKLNSRSKVIVTGGAGFLGRHIVESLERRGVRPIVPRTREWDLRVWERAKGLIEESKPDLVIHAAWTGGGIGFMREHPGVIARDNLLMNTHVIEACRLQHVSKFIGVGSICSYPKFTPVPFKEEDLWKGYPEETNAAYGLSKKMMLVMTQAYAQEFAMNGVHLLMVNLYGPWDNFDLASSHVIPAMIRKFIAGKERGEKHVTLWGDGSPTREFVYVSDAAEAIVLAAERYDSPEPVNIGSSEEISIRDLAINVAQLVGFDGKVIWDTSKPNGQPRRKLDVTKAAERFGFTAKVLFAEGLSQTVKWYFAEGRQLWERPNPSQ